MTMVKISLLFLLIRIGVENVWKWVLIACIGAFSIVTIIDMGIILGRCRPMQSLWNLAVKGECIISANAMNSLNYAQVCTAFILLTCHLLANPLCSVCNFYRFATCFGARSNDGEAPHATQHENTSHMPLRFRTSVSWHAIFPF
jgi:hypothetical protein